WGNRPTNSRILPIQETPIPKADKALGLAAAVMLIMILVSSQKGKQTDVEGDPVASFKAQEVAPVMSGTPVASSLGNTAESSALLANESVADSAGTKDTVPAASTMTIERPKQPRHINTPLDDRLFNPAVYAMLSDHDRVDGGFVGERYTGQVLSREKLAEIAVERFEEQAEFLGIERGDITRAMLEGAFNPYAVDALLVAQGVGQAFAGTPEKPIPPAQSKSGRSATVEETDKHHAAVMQYRADISNYRNEIDGYRSAAWGERYGRVRDIEDAGVSTIIDGVERRVSGNDLALRMVQKSTSGSNLEALGLSNDVTLTYKEAARVVETKSPKLQQYFHDRMELMRGLCPVQYFDLTYHDWRHYVRDSVDGYATYADYRQLRATKYIGRLRSLGYVTTSKVEAFTAGEY
ncbi:hypothetical protein, partial [Rosistilla oblonga]|uniref:hypothetical protein n=1 Tax=Rosistilla oblonga TaxID=2527990 RepID=UPI003A973F28